MVGVNEYPGEGHRSRYRMPGSDVSMKTIDGILSVRAKIGSLVGLPAIGTPAVELDLHFDITAQPPLTVISDLDTDPPAVSTTGKNAALPVNGRVVIRHAGLLHAFDFADAVGGFDYTSGFLPRHTHWRWAYLTGNLADDRAFGLNLSADFSGLQDAPARTPWVGRGTSRHRPRRQHHDDQTAPEDPWLITTSDGAVDLEFTPIGVHRESLNLGLLRSRFLQPVGEFRRDRQARWSDPRRRRLPRVVENQDVLW
ncbi:MAG: DUF2804 family protein [Candidatus Nanopelagicales bacterium]